MEQTGPKYSKFRKPEYLQENTIKFRMFFWKQSSIVIIPRVKILARLKFGLSHFREDKLKHSLHDSLKPSWSCSRYIETSAHFVLHYPNYSNERSVFLNIIGSIDGKSLRRSNFQVTQTLLCGDSNSNSTVDSR